MKKLYWILPIITLVVGIVYYISVSSNTSSSYSDSLASSSMLPTYTMSSSTISTSASTSSSQASVTDTKYFKYDGKLSATSKNILFFRASWCPTCKYPILQYLMWIMITQMN
jgi:thiol-disulfide isomerase/thioredoxin